MSSYPGDEYWAMQQPSRIPMSPAPPPPAPAHDEHCEAEELALPSTGYSACGCESRRMEPPALVASSPKERKAEER